MWAYPVHCGLLSKSLTIYCVQVTQDSVADIGADFRFEVPGQSLVELIGGGSGQWLGGTIASAEHEANGGLGAEHPAGSMGRAPGQGGKAPLKLKAFWSFDVQRSRQI